MDDKLLQMSVTIHSNPGVYALLLGSGISFPAKIPTGWQLMEKLILKIATVYGENPDNPSDWYKTKFEKPPRYDDVLQQLAATPAERNAILRPEFERQDDEDEEIKRPTKAHRAIASLIKRGYFKVVLTTNFDRLLEQALEAEGITPYVISTDSALEGARPPQHSKIIIYKLHGDYLDDSFKNIASELGEYNETWKAHLDRILDEYGLIVCGWSADWDKALIHRFEAAKSRRYTTFWSAYPQALDTTKRLIDYRDANLIEGKTADELFTELEANISALENFYRPPVLSVAVAVERVKKLIPDESKYIELEDFVKREVAEAYNRTQSFEFNPIGTNDPKIAIKNLFDRYFHAYEIPLNLLSALAWYGKPLQRDLLKFSIKQAASNFHITSNAQDVISALLLFYTTSLIALYRENWIYLPAIMIETEHRNNYRSSQEYHPILPDVIRCYLDLADLYGKSNKLFGNELKEKVKLITKPFILSNQDFDERFDLLEMLLGLVCIDINMPKVWSSVDLTSGKFHTHTHHYLAQYWLRAGRLGPDWGLLKTGTMFNGDTARVKEVLLQYEDKLKKNDLSYGDGDRDRPKFSEKYAQGLKEGRR